MAHLCVQVQFSSHRTFAWSWWLTTVPIYSVCFRSKFIYHCHMASFTYLRFNISQSTPTTQIFPHSSHSTKADAENIGQTWKMCMLAAHDVIPLGPIRQKQFPIPIQKEGFGQFIHHYRGSSQRVCKHRI